MRNTNNVQNVVPNSGVIMFKSGVHMHAFCLPFIVYFVIFAHCKGLEGLSVRIWIEFSKLPLKQTQTQEAEKFTRELVCSGLVLPGSAIYTWFHGGNLDPLKYAVKFRD